MEPSSSIPVRSGIPRPTSRLPVPRSSASQSQLRPTASSEQLRKKPSVSSISRLSQAAPSLQKKPSRSSLVPSKPSSASASATTSSSRASITSNTTRVPSGSLPRSFAHEPSGFKRPIGRPPSRQTRIKSQSTAPAPAPAKTSQEEDVLGDLGAFRSASRASSRAGFRETESESVVESDSEPANPTPRKSRPSLSDRTIESLSHLPASPAPGKGRRRSSFFNADNSMGPPSRPASALGNNGRPTTSDGTPQARPMTPRRLGVVSQSQRGSMTAPGKRSVSAAVAPSLVSTPSKAPLVTRPISTIKKLPLSQMLNSQTPSKPRPLSNSKTMVARTPKTRPSLASTFGQALSPPGTAATFTPSPTRAKASAKKTPETSRKVSASSAALREQIAKAKAARRSDVSSIMETPVKVKQSSGALKDHIAKAKEAARRANAGTELGRNTPPREPILPDPTEVAEFDFGLDDPFNQGAKGSKSLLRKRVDGARVDGRLNIAAMGLSEIPDDIKNMYKYDPDDNTINWGETVDLTSILAADNEFQQLPDDYFPDVDYESIVDDDDQPGPLFGAVESIDIHGNGLQQLPMGLRRLTQLSKLNLSRNKLTIESFTVISQIQSLRELRLADNALEGALPAAIGGLTRLELLELQGNKLTSLPVEIRELAHLRSLNVSNNRLTNIPRDLFISVPIVELLANNNSFNGAFFDVDTIPHLKTLHLSKNALSSLCESGGVSLPALTYMDLSTNRLSSLPDMSPWTNLVTLLLAGNKFASIPEGFTTLHQLRNADFTGNDLTKLDEKIALMERLENLTLAANPLRDRKFLTMATEDIKRDLFSRLEPAAEDAAQDESFPGETPSQNDNGWQLKSAGTLDLSFQNLSEVDEKAVVAFAESNDVRQLCLPQNYLTIIPSFLSQLQFLTVLDVSKNTIVDPLIEPLALPKLRELRLAGNKIQSFDSIMSLFSAPNLQQLNVSNNRISGSLPTFRATFPQLYLLMASDNELTEVSADALEGLKIVNLSNNSIGRLEPRIGRHAGTLTSFEVEGNTFRVPNYAILKKGTNAILTWLQDKIPSPTEEFFDPGSPES